MFDVTSSKLLLLGIVALIVIGPKDLPVLLRTIGKYAGIVRRQAAEFRAQFDEAMRESELDQLKKDVESMGAEAEASMRETESAVATELAAAQAEVESGTDARLLDKPPEAQSPAEQPVEPAADAEVAPNGTGGPADKEPEIASSGPAAERKTGA